MAALPRRILQLPPAGHGTLERLRRIRRTSASGRFATVGRRLWLPSTKKEPVMDQFNVVTKPGEPWNLGKLVGQKSPFKLKEIWAIRIRLQLANCTRDLALFDLAIDSKLRACDLVRLRVRDVSHGDRVAARTIVMQQKTQRPVQFEITEQSRDAIAVWIGRAHLKAEDFLF